MKPQTITFNNFTGGAATDIYQAQSNEIGWSLDLNNYTKKGRVFNYASSTDLGKTNVLLITIASYTLSTHSGFYAAWQDTAPDLNPTSSKLFFYDYQTAAWNDIGTLPNGLKFFGKMFKEYHKKLCFFVADATNVNLYVMVYDIASATFTYLPYQLKNGNGTNFIGECFDGIVNDFDDNLYFSYGNYIGFWNEDLNNPAYTLFGVPRLIVPDSYEIVSLTRWNESLLLGMNLKLGGGNSKIGFWDTFSADLSYTKNIPYGNIDVLRLVEGNVLCVTSYNDFDTAQRASANNSLFGYVYNGGEFELVGQQVGIRRRGTQVSPAFVTNRFTANAVHGSHLFFLAPLIMRGYNDPYGTIEIVVWRFGKNHGVWQFTPDRRQFNATSGNNLSLNFYNDLLIESGPTGTYIQRHGATTPFIARNGILLSQRHDCGFKWRKKKLRAFQINTIPSSTFENPAESSATNTITLLDNTTKTVPMDSITLTIITGNNNQYVVPLEHTTFDYGSEWTADLEQCGVASQEWETIQFFFNISGTMQLAEYSFVYEIKPQKIYDRSN